MIFTLFLFIIIEFIFINLNDLVIGSVKNNLTNYTLWIRDKNKNFVHNPNNTFNYKNFEVNIFGQLRGVYSEGRKHNTNIPLNNHDCENLVERHDFGKYSCKEIINNSCFKDEHSCYTFDPRVKDKIVSVININYVNEIYFIFFMYITALITFNFGRCCCDNTIFTIARRSGCNNHALNMIIILPQVVSLIFMIVLLLPFVSIHLNFNVLSDTKTLSSSLTNVITGNTLSNFSTIKPNNIKDYNFVGCHGNNWIATEYDFPNCTTYYGIKLCCIENNFGFSKDALKLMKYQKATMKTLNYNPVYYDTLIHNLSHVFEIISYYVQFVDIIIMFLLFYYYCSICRCWRTNTHVQPNIELTNY